MPAPKKYPDELKERAVRLVFESGRPIAQVAKDLGVHREALRLWVRQAEADAGDRQDRLTSGERERMKALERENREPDDLPPDHRSGRLKPQTERTGYALLL